MVDHSYPNFLHDSCQYALSERHWIGLWQDINPPARMAKGWKEPWFEPLPPSLGEGNPIFSAVSQTLRRGIRVIQHEPADSGVEIQAWLDTFGGGPGDPGRIEELVISCALSNAASGVARSLMEPWVNGECASLDAINAIGSLISLASTEVDDGRRQTESAHGHRSAGAD